MPTSLHDNSTSQHQNAVHIPCVGEFKNGGGGFYDQESRSKHPMLFRVLPFAFIRFCANFRGRE